MAPEGIQTRAGLVAADDPRQTSAAEVVRDLREAIDEQMALRPQSPSAEQFMARLVRDLQIGVSEGTVLRSDMIFVIEQAAIYFDELGWPPTRRRMVD